MYRASQANIEQNFGRFAEQCATDVFAVPDALMQANDLAENLPSCSVEEEKAKVKVVVQAKWQSIL